LYRKERRLKAIADERAKEEKRRLEAKRLEESNRTFTEQPLRSVATFSLFGAAATLRAAASIAETVTGRELIAEKGATDAAEVAKREEDFGLMISEDDDDLAVDLKVHLYVLHKFTLDCVKLHVCV
jgi:hypothetical protein